MKFSKLNLFKLFFILTLLVVGCFYVVFPKPANAAVTNSPSDVFGVTMLTQITSCSVGSTSFTLRVTLSIDKNKLKNGDKSSILTNNRSYFSLYSYYNNNFQYLNQNNFTDDGKGHYIATLDFGSVNKATQYVATFYIEAYDQNNQLKTQTQTDNNVIYYRCFNDVNLQISSVFKDYWAVDPSSPLSARYYYNSYDFTLSIDPAKLENGELISVLINYGDGQSASFILDKNNYSILKNHIYFSTTRGILEYTASVSGWVYKNGYLVNPQPINLTAPAPNTLNTINVNFKGKPNIYSISGSAICNKNKVTNTLGWYAKEASIFIINRKERAQSVYQPLATMPGNLDINNTSYTYSDNSTTLDSTKEYDYQIIADDGLISPFPATLSTLQASCGPNYDYFYLSEITSQISTNLTKDGVQIIFDANKAYDKLKIQRRKNSEDFQDITTFSYNQNCWSASYNPNCERHLYQDYGTDSNPFLRNTDYTYRVGANYIDNSGVEKWAWSQEQTIKIVGQAPIVNSFIVESLCNISEQNSSLDPSLKVVTGNKLRFTWNVANADIVYIHGGKNANSLDEFTQQVPASLGTYDYNFDWSQPWSTSRDLKYFYIVAYKSNIGANASPIFTIDPIQDCVPHMSNAMTIPFCDGNNSKIRVEGNANAKSVLIRHTNYGSSTQTRLDLDSSGSFHNFIQDAFSPNSYEQYWIYPVNDNGISYQYVLSSLLTMDCGGGVPTEKESRITGNISAKDRIDINSKVKISSDSVFSTSSGSIVVGNNVQQLSSYNPLNIAKWGLAKQKADQAIKKLEIEQASPISSIGGSFCLYSGLSNSCTPDDEKNYPNGRIWRYNGNGDLILGTTAFYGRGTIIAEGNIVINGNITTGNNSSLGIIANGGDITINSKDNNITNIQGFYYATKGININ
ncbi:MAG: hypothetical protein M1338_02315 [Patescibacteria group bacterium]|nr:hypothetical protein [Patescibacteria group bacterium]